jgi:hypothetical protein
VSTISRAQTLNYSRPGQARPSVALFKIAFFCWIAPLVRGVMTLLLSWASHEAHIFPFRTRSKIAVFGLFTLLAGIALFFIGTVCLAVFASLLRRCESGERARWSKRARLLLGGLILNFPVAFLCAWAGLTLVKLK